MSGSKKQTKKQQPINQLPPNRYWWIAHHCWPSPLFPTLIMLHHFPLKSMTGTFNDCNFSICLMSKNNQNISWPKGEILCFTTKISFGAVHKVLRQTLQSGAVSSPDGGGTWAMLSGVHHPANVALHGRVGAVSGLPLPRRLKSYREHFVKVGWK